MTCSNLTTPLLKQGVSGVHYLRSNSATPTLVMAYGKFEAEKYANQRFGALTEDGYVEFLLKCLADFYTTWPISAKSNLQILDYGCGPSLPYSISAASKASEIVLADYSAPNREYLQKWLDRDASAHDWTPCFRHIVQTLEGGSAEEASKREEEFHCKVKAVVACDILEDRFIDESYMGTYDIVMSFLCLESAYKDFEGYQSGVAKLVSLVKKGGYFLLYSTRRENSDEGFYMVGGIKYPDIALKRDAVVKTLEQNGLTV